EAALKGDSRLIFGVSQRENVDHVTPAVLYTTGTIAKISQIQRGLGGVQLLLHGEKRGAAVHYVENQGHLEAVVREVEDLPPLRPDDPAFVGLHREARERAAELGQKSGLPEEVVRQVLEGVSDPGRLADLVAGYLEIDPAERQALLETLEVEERLRRVLVHVQRQIGVLDAQEHIKSQVQEELGERQRELFLREQMKAIRKELGEGDETSDVEELRKRLAALQLPDAAQKEVERELARLERAARDSMEAQVIRTYLETVAELPWNKRAEESLDLKRAAAILDEDHYGLQDVKDEVLEFLSVRQLRQRTPEGDARGNDDDKQSKGSIVLFVAPANFLQYIPAPLLDRLETVNFAGYTEREKLEIAKRYLLTRQLQENGLAPGQLTVDDAALSKIITSYTREAGVRQLEREIGKVARAALTYAKSHADQLGIPEEALAETAVHIHVPAGAIPKDGPSAGVTMATALVSALSRRPARHDVAMTGEITLRGRVLPIGGVKEKVLGAVRAGLRTIVLPKENAADLEDLPEDVRKSLEVHLVEDLG